MIKINNKIPRAWISLLHLINNAGIGRVLCDGDLTDVEEQVEFPSIASEAIQARVGGFCA